MDVKEYFLHEIIRFGVIPEDPSTRPSNKTGKTTEKTRECLGVADCNPANQFIVTTFGGFVPGRRNLERACSLA